MNRWSVAAIQLPTLRQLSGADVSGEKLKQRTPLKSSRM
jgi:hypothetical protein